MSAPMQPVDVAIAAARCSKRNGCNAFTVRDGGVVRFRGMLDTEASAQPRA